MTKDHRRFNLRLATKLRLAGLVFDITSSILLIVSVSRFRRVIIEEEVIDEEVRNDVTTEVRLENVAIALLMIGVIFVVWAELVDNPTENQFRDFFELQRPSHESYVLSRNQMLQQALMSEGIPTSI